MGCSDSSAVMIQAAGGVSRDREACPVFFVCFARAAKEMPGVELTTHVCISGYISGDLSIPFSNLQEKP